MVPVYAAGPPDSGLSDKVTVASIAEEFAIARPLWRAPATSAYVRNAVATLAAGTPPSVTVTCPARKRNSAIPEGVLSLAAGITRTDPTLVVPPVPAVRNRRDDLPGI